MYKCSNFNLFCDSDITNLVVSVYTGWVTNPDQKNEYFLYMECLSSPCIYLYSAQSACNITWSNIHRL